MMPTVYGWLIENGERGDSLRYRTMDAGVVVWTSDHMKALRFSRREDAERFSYGDEEARRIVEHAWHDAAIAKAEGQ
jgi:hypothetical protein